MHWLASPRFNYHLHSGSTGWPSANVQDMAPTRLKIPKAVERLAGDRSLARPESGRRPRYQPGNRSPSLEQCHNIGPGKHQAVMRFKLIPLRDVIEGGRGHALHLRHRHPDGVETTPLPMRPRMRRQSRARREKQSALSENTSAYVLDPRAYWKQATTPVPHPSKGSADTACDSLGCMRDFTRNAFVGGAQSPAFDEGIDRGNDDEGEESG
jgi:hypothetical protein